MLPRYELWFNTRPCQFNQLGALINVTGRCRIAENTPNSWLMNSMRKLRDFNEINIYMALFAPTTTVERSLINDEFLLATYQPMYL